MTACAIGNDLVYDPYDYETVLDPHPVFRRLREEAHTIHRALLSRMFIPRRVSALEPEIRHLCVKMLDPLVGKGGFDLGVGPS